MSVAWTKEQQRVIEVRNRDVLVSAAAGSGKTAVLVERILSLVLGEEAGDRPLDVDELLVVTFTNAAAAEMRERIGEALEKRLEADPENVHLQRQQTLIHNAQITTIHSFCQYVIRNYFHKLDLDPAFRIGDEGELKLLKGEVLKDLLEERYQERTERFLAFVESYAYGKSDEVLEELVLKLYEFSLSFPYPQRWLSKCLKNYQVTDLEELEESTWMQYLLSYARQILRDLQEEVKGAKWICGLPEGPYMYEAALQADEELLERLCACETYEEYRLELLQLSFARLSAKKDETVSEEKKTQIKAMREKMKKVLKDLKENYFSCSEAEVLELLEKAAPVTEELLSLVNDFAQRYQERKRQKNLADFSDLEHLALQILVEDVKEEETGLKLTLTDAARELSEHYAQIMIDEYQDSNLIQEIILNSVSRREAGEPNVFMVGDVKQSIYRFRQAKPELFMEKYHRYPQEGEGQELRIDLHKNFRSRKEVLEGTNEVFAQIMTASLGGISYDQAAALYLGADFPEAEHRNENVDANGKSMYAPEFLLVETDVDAAKGEEELTRQELEAHAAAARIKELLKNQQIWDRKKEAFRPAQYGDIVILLRSLTGWGEVFARVLTEEGIPAHTESRTGYFTTTEIQTLLNLLRVVDNPRQDIPLAAVLKSMIGGFSDRELARIKSAFSDRPFYEACLRYQEEIGEENSQEEIEERLIKKKLAVFYERLERYRNHAEYLSIHEFLWYVLEDSGYGDYLAAQPAGEQRKANVEMLISRAIAFEATSYHGLFHFVRYIEQLQSYNEDFGEASITGENENAVRIMTIHKSKGLEFPIVLVAGLGKSFNRQDTKSRVVIHPELGLGVDFVDAKLRLKVPLLPKKVLQKALDLEMLAEELRVLYVAFTRAKEKLILLGGGKKLEEKVSFLRAGEEREKRSFLELSSAGTYLDFLLPAIAAHENTIFSIKQISPEVQVEEKLEEGMTLENQRARLEDLLKEPKDEAFAEKLKEALSFVYPYAQGEGLQAKFSVSELKKASVAGEEEDALLIYGPEEIVPYVPQFMKQEQRVSGAQRGTIYHRVLEHMEDFSRFTRVSEVKEELRQMEKKGWLTKEEADLVYPFDICAFAGSDLARRMEQAQKAKRLYTEQPFVIQLPASELEMGYADDEPVLVQGIIDAYFEEDDGLVIVDYKTDYVEQAGQLLKRYHRQLEYYALALERLTGRPVKEKIIYSFCLRQMLFV